MNTELIAFRKVKEFAGLDAVLARNIVHAFIMLDMEKLRDCQLYAAEVAIEQGAVINTTKSNRTSPVCKIMRDAGIFEQLDIKDRPKGYVLYDGPRMGEFQDFLNDNPNYGKTLRVSSDRGVTMAQALLLEHLDEYGCVRANSVTNKIPSKVYKALADKAALGELDVIYVPRGTVAAVKHNGVQHKAEYYVD
jgi:hypothetical protein